MRYFLLIIVSIIAVGNAKMAAQNNTITLDAVYLTLKMQSGIVLDSAKARSFDSNLALAKRKLGLDPRANYYYGRYSFNVVEAEFSSTDTLLVNSWQQGKITTGNRKFDSLSTSLGAVSVESLVTYKTSLGFVISRVKINFSAPINDQKARSAYMEHGFEFYRFSGGVSFSSGRVSYSTSLDYFHCNDSFYFIFGSGSGDCPAGCLNFKYYYSAVRQVDTGKVVTSEASYGWGDNFAPPYDRPYPRTIPYNFPDVGYSVTQFGSADVLIQSLRHPTWWVQNHAIQGIWRVLTSETPISLDGYWTDSARKAQWSFIRHGVLSRRTEIVSTLQSLRGTGICGVSVSIDTALKRILTVGVSEEALVQTLETIITAPNPFGEMLQISYNVSQYSHIKVSIVNTLGETVATLFNGYQTEGQLSLEWQPENMPSGIYSVQIWKNSHPLSSKRIALIR